MENNNNTVLKILIGVIASFSAILLISGILYVRGIHKKISTLEKEQQEQLKKQVEVQEMPTVQVVTESKPNNEVKTESPQNSTTTANNTDTNTTTFKKGSIFITKSTSGPVNVRAEASMNSEIIERLSDNVILRYVSRKGNWYYISYNIRGYNEYGYIHKSQMTR